MAGERAAAGVPVAEEAEEAVSVPPLVSVGSRAIFRSCGLGSPEKSENRRLEACGGAEAGI